MHNNLRKACWIFQFSFSVLLSAAAGTQQIAAGITLVRSYDENAKFSEKLSESSILALDVQGYLFVWNGKVCIFELVTGRREETQQGLNRDVGGYVELSTGEEAACDAHLLNPLRQYLSSDFKSYVYKIRPETPFNAAELGLFLRENVSIAIKAEQKRTHYVWRHYGGYGIDDREHIRFESVKQIQSLVGHNGKILCTALDQSGEFFLTGSDDQTAILWQLDLQRADEPRAKTLENIGVCRRLKFLKVFIHERPVLSVSFNLDGSIIHTQTRTADNQFKENHFWDHHTGALLNDNPYQRSTNLVIFHPRRPLLIVINNNNGKLVQLWNTETKTCTASFENQHSINRLLLNQDGSCLACISYDPKYATVWSLH